jgi:hypothetical protein
MYSNNLVVSEQDQHGKVVSEQDQQNKVVSEQDQQNKVVSEQDQHGKVVSEQGRQNKVVSEQDQQNKVVSEQDQHGKVVSEEDQQNKVVSEQDQQNKVVSEQDQQNKVVSEQNQRLNAGQESSVPVKKSRMKFLDSETYNNLLLYLSNESFIEKKDRKKYKRLAEVYYLDDDNSGEYWPKGKIIYRKMYAKNNKNIVSGRKLVVPPTKVDQVIKIFHCGPAQHQGWKRTYKFIKVDHFGVSEQAVRFFINKCETCVQFTPVLKKPRLAPIMSTAINERIQVDMKEYELYEHDNDGYRYQLTVVDHFSGYAWAFPTFTKNKEEVSSILIKLFFEIGPPKILHSDNGGEFVNGIIEIISETMKISLANGKAYNPREQGKVEKFNGTIAVLLSKRMHETQSKRWIDFLDECLFAYRITVGDTTQKSPYELYFIRKPNFVFSLPEINDRELKKAR